MRLRSVLLAAFAVAACARAADRPNIVYILADDLGYGDLGCYNADSKIPTPRLDRLAKEGLRFTDAHASDSVCTPSRYGILTGRYSFRSALKNGVIIPWGEPIIEKSQVTVPSFLRQQGYATAIIGKWHLGWTWPTRDGKPPQSKDGIGNVDFSRPVTDGPIDLGFDSFFGVDLPNYPPYCFIANDHTVGIPATAVKLAKGGFNRAGPMVPGWDLSAIMPTITQHAVRYIEDAAASSSKKPFFLYFALTAPHYPIVPTAQFKGRSRAGIYGDYVTEVDATVGAVLDALEQTGQASRTLVIFSSDNGPEVIEVDPGAYERIRMYDHDSMDGLRGAKRDAWEGGHRIPFLARWPGHIAAGGSSDAVICEMDLMATCSAILEKPLPSGAGEDSFNILPILLGQKDAPARTPLVLHSLDGKFGIREGDWIFIDAPTGEGNGPKGREPAWFKQARGYVDDNFPGELYNIKDDRPERSNLYGEHPDLVSKFKAQLAPYEAVGHRPATAKSIPQE